MKTRSIIRKVFYFIIRYFHSVEIRPTRHDNNNVGDIVCGVLRELIATLRAIYQSVLIADGNGVCVFTFFYF